MLIVTLIILTVLLIFTFLFGYVWGVRKSSEVVCEMLDEKQQKVFLSKMQVLDDEPETKVEHIEDELFNTETINNVIYVYKTAEDNKFAVQGSTLEECSKKLVEYLNVNAALIKHDNKWFLLHEGNLNPITVENK